MTKQIRPPALKHGIYSGIALLPGEDAAAFKKLEKEVVEEFEPSGPLENDICMTLTRLLWRKQNLSTYRLAKQAKDRIASAGYLFGCSWPMPLLGPQEDEATMKENAERAAVSRAAEDARVRKELGASEKLVDLGDVITFDYLEKEFELMDRLDGLIDRCVKRLLMVRGLKSVSRSGSSEPPKRIA